MLLPEFVCLFHLLRSIMEFICTEEAQSLGTDSNSDEGIILGWESEIVTKESVKV